MFLVHIYLAFEIVSFFVISYCYDCHLQCGCYLSLYRIYFRTKNRLRLCQCSSLALTTLTLFCFVLFCLALTWLALPCLALPCLVLSCLSPKIKAMFWRTGAVVLVFVVLLGSSLGPELFCLDLVPVHQCCSPWRLRPLEASVGPKWLCGTGSSGCASHPIYTFPCVFNDSLARCRKILGDAFMKWSRLN